MAWAARMGAKERRKKRERRRGRSNTAPSRSRLG
jgi:hypothetical protein